MTTVGKILVVLHLVMSVMFMAFAAAVFTAQKNWRTAQNTAAAALVTANTKMKDMQAETEKQLADIAQKNAKLEDEVVRLKGLNTALELEFKTLTTDNKQLRKEVDQQRDQAALTTTEATERKKEADLQREKNGEFFKSRESLVEQLHELEDKRFSQDLQIQQISEKYDLLLNDYKIMKSFLASKELTTDPKEMVGMTAPPPPLDGRVTDVKKADKGSREMMEISLGSDSGLVVGNKLTIFNDKNYLGEVRLMLVEPDRSVGYVIKRAKNATFHVNDQVTTKF
jgi:chromosome segregation ATPase